MIPLVLSRLAKVISTRDEITEQLVNFQREGLVGKDNPVSVIIDGKSLTFALDPSLKKDFLELCCSCQGRTGLNAIATICQLYLSVEAIFVRPRKSDCPLSRVGGRYF